MRALDTSHIRIGASYKLNLTAVSYQPAGISKIKIDLTQMIFLKIETI